MKQIINVTDISSYLYCPRKLYLKLVKKIREPTTKPMILGFLKHKVFDLFNKNESLIVSAIQTTITESELNTIYQKHLINIIQEIAINYENMIKGFKIEPRELQEGVIKFMANEIKLRTKAIKENLSLGFSGKELWRNLEPKYLTEFEIVSDTLGLKGRVDRIEISKQIIPYEIKTRKEIFDSDKIQLAAYALLIEQEFGKEINKGVIETQAGQEEIQITKEMKDEVLEIADEIRNMQNEPPFQSNMKKCQKCLLKKQCFEE